MASSPWHSPRAARSTGRAGNAGRDSAGREKGAREAAEAVAAGKLTLKEYPPLPSPAWQGKYIRLLPERGVGYEVPSRPPGVDEAAFVAEIRGWNGDVEAEVKRKHGPDVFERLREEATRGEKAPAPPVGKR